MNCRLINIPEVSVHQTVKKQTSHHLTPISNIIFHGEQTFIAYLLFALP